MQSYTFVDYLKAIGTTDLVDLVSSSSLNTFVEDSFKQTHTFTAAETEKLYTYSVPQMSEDGSCSLVDTPASEPYNLAFIHKLTPDWEALKDNERTEWLWHLQQVVGQIYPATGVDWFGIYKKMENTKGEIVLAKQAYKGSYSRAEFPLTEEFASHSNNSTVGMSGRARVIQDVSANEGPYYKCDGKVMSEFCLPILGKDKEVIGIIDAESFPKQFFTSDRLLQIAKVAYDLGLYI